MATQERKKGGTLKKISKRKAKIKPPQDYFSSTNSDTGLPPFFLNCISFLEECGMHTIIFIILLLFVHYYYFFIVCYIVHIICCCVK